MTKDEWLLNKLMEECSEVMRTAALCQQFGLDGRVSGSASTNRDHLISDTNDLIAIKSLLEEEGLLPRSGMSLSMAQAGKHDKLKRQLDEFLAKTAATPSA